MDSPIVYFGGKRKAAPLIWRLFGRVYRYVDPFMGSLSVPLACPYEIPRVVVNDLNCLLVNFWRALQRDPEAVAYWAEYPSSHVDLMARREWLRQQWPTAVQAMQLDPEWHDARMAGWYVWVVSNAIDLTKNLRPATVDMQQAYAKAVATARQFRLDWDTQTLDTPDISPVLGQQKQRVMRPRGPQDKTSDQISMWIGGLAEHMRTWIIICKDWTSIVSSRVILGTIPSEAPHVCALLLDPPYDTGVVPRGKVYAVDDTQIASTVRGWLFTPNEKDGIIPWYHPRLRIILCAYEGDHDPLPDSRTYRWSDRSDAHNQIPISHRPQKKEILIANPACLDPDGARQESLF